jgi:hypothetical protein
VDSQLIYLPQGGVPLTTKGDILVFGTAVTRLPVGTNGQLLTVDPSQTTGLLWKSVAPTPTNIGVTSVTANITLDANNDAVLASGSGGTFTITLPSASGNTGKTFFLKRTDSTPTKPIIISTQSNQTIDGGPTLVHLVTQYEEWTLASDGSNWDMLTHEATTKWVTEAGLGFTGFGTLTNANFFSRRHGDSYEVIGNATCGTPTAATAMVFLPSGYVIDTAKLSTQNSTNVGTYNSETSSSVQINTAQQYNYVVYDGSTNNGLFFGHNTASTAVTKSTGSGVGISGQVFFLSFKIPISGWEA